MTYAIELLENELKRLERRKVLLDMDIKHGRPEYADPVYYKDQERLDVIAAIDKLKKD